MAIGSVTYSTPVTVNGFQCRDCSDVELARKHIDPAHPKSGPDNRDALHDPSRNDADPVKIAAARKAAEARTVTGYGPDGIRVAAVPAGKLVSISA